MVLYLHKTYPILQYPCYDITNATARRKPTIHNPRQPLILPTCCILLKRRVADDFSFMNYRPKFSVATSPGRGGFRIVVTAGASLKITRLWVCGCVCCGVVTSFHRRPHTHTHIFLVHKNLHLCVLTVLEFHCSGFLLVRLFVSGVRLFLRCSSSFNRSAPRQLTIFLKRKEIVIINSIFCGRSILSVFVSRQ
jgi:hypothetical protein